MKRSLTLLEVIIAITLLGILLTGLFDLFLQGTKKNIAAKEMKQTVLQLQLFQQKMKILFSQENGVWIESHPDATGAALFTAFEQKADPDFDMCGDLQGMLFLNSKKELCFISWSAQSKERMETLLDNVDSFECKLFDGKKGEWCMSWPSKKTEGPLMVSIKLEWKGTKTPFVFFLRSSSEKISYGGGP